MVTLQHCEQAWKRFDQLKEEAENHMFPSIMVWDLRLTPLYEDLNKNWNEHHGEIFLKGMVLMFKMFGIEFVPEQEAAYV